MSTVLIVLMQINLYSLAARDSYHRANKNFLHHLELSEDLKVLDKLLMHQQVHGTCLEVFIIVLTFLFRLILTISNIDLLLITNLMVNTSTAL